MLPADLKRFTQPDSKGLFINIFKSLYQLEDDRLLAEQVKLVMTVESKGLLFSSIVAIALYWFLFGRTNTIAISLWFFWLVTCSLVLARIMFVLLKNPNAQAKQTAYFLMLANAILATNWGLLAWVAVDGVSIFNSIIVIAVLVSLLVGLMSTLSPILPLYVIACVTMTGIVSSKLLTLDHSEFNNVGLFSLVTCIIFIIMGRDMNMQGKKNIYLQFDKLDLIAKLGTETEKVRTAQHIAENANQAKTKFLAAASHDIRQPIHALGLFLEVLARSPLSQYQQQVLQNANSAFEASADMLNTLLDFSRIEAGVVEVQQRAFYLQPILNKLENEMAPLAANKNLIYRSQESHAIVMSDPIILELILRNLISNAIRYTDKGGVLIACRNRGNFTSLEIWDTGIGIDPIHHENIFNEFYQLGNTERDRRKGLGLGLAIVRGYANRLKHPLLFASKPKRGSVFKIELLNATEMPLSDATIIKPIEFTKLGARVLIVDDDEAVRQGMVDLLQAWGCHCDAADSIEEAVTFAIANPPDLVVSDFRLRDMKTGTQAITQIRNVCGTSTPAMLITGDTAQDRLIDATASGLPLLSKPVSPAVLYRKVVELLA